MGRTALGAPISRNSLVGDSARPHIGYYIRHVWRPRQDCTTGKVQAMPVCTTERLLRDNLEPMKEFDTMTDLGGLISNDGRVDAELSRRIGFASAEFKEIKQAWSNAILTRSRKLEFFQTFVMSRLQYGLCTTLLVKSQRRRLDGFHARCLRRILGIPPSFLSRVSNANVFSRMNALPI